MVYKIGNLKDMEVLPPTDEQTSQLIYRYAKRLSTEYGEDRNIDSDGGYILYATPKSNAEEIKAYFDYSRHIAEYVELCGDICSATYLLNNDYVVTVLTRLEDTPVEIANELD